MASDVLTAYSIQLLPVNFQIALQLISIVPPPPISVDPQNKKWLSHRAVVFSESERHLCALIFSCDRALIVGWRSARVDFSISSSSSRLLVCWWGITLHFTLINKERCQKVSILAPTLIVGHGEMLSWVCVWVIFCLLDEQEWVF